MNGFQIMMADQEDPEPSTAGGFIKTTATYKQGITLRMTLRLAEQISTSKGCEGKTTSRLVGGIETQSSRRAHTPGVVTNQRGIRDVP